MGVPIAGEGERSIEDIPHPGSNCCIDSAFMDLYNANGIGLVCKADKER